MKFLAWKAASLLLVVLVCLSPRESGAAQPSFDCAAARAPIERLICSSDTLATLDAELGRTFAAQQAARDPQARRSALEDQQKWLRQRLTDCGVAATGIAAPPAGAEACVTALYRARLVALAATTREVPAAGRQAQVFEVPSVGRYAVRVESDVGVALSLIDRMAGPLGNAGAAGSEDGRVDLILDRGSYKAVTTGPDDAEGNARLRVDAFRELSPTPPPRLVELKPVDSELDDLTQRSWWIDVPTRREIFIEAAGRHLADLRLWQDGSWLVAAAPAAETIEPVNGQPLQLRRLTATLEPGLYLLTAYGGPAAPWAQQSDAKPFHLRFGIPQIAVAARLVQQASAFGFDRFLVPEAANLGRLTIDQPAPASLGTQVWNPGAAVGPAGTRAEIAKNSRDPYAELGWSTPKDRLSLLTVTREPGKPYRLEVIPSASFYRFSGTGDYWLEALDIGASDDTADLTSVLIEGSSNGERVIADTALTLAPGRSWQRRFNLLDRVTLYVKLPSPGEWQVKVEGDGVEAESRFEIAGARPANYRVPALERDGFAWRLESGLYLLTLQPRPEKKGIATVTLAPAGANAAPPPGPRQEAFALRTQRLVSNTDYRLYSNIVPGVRRGLVLRKLPIDLARDLPVTLRPRERVEVPVTVPVAGVLEIVDENGGTRPFVFNGGASVAWVAAAPGNHRVAVANATDKPVALVLRLRPDALRPEAPLPALAADRFRSIPSFPALTADRPVFLDLAQNEQRTFNVVVKTPSLFRLETTGLLKTEGTLRTRTVTALGKDLAGGTGRNFLIQRYLREGDYQLSFATSGRSAGHLGLSLKAAPIIAAGGLTLAAPSRATLRPGTALAWDFAIDHAGSYTLSALGLGRSFDMRVEDDDGWPVAAAIVPGNLELDFEPGRYRLIVLPQPDEARVVATLAEQPAAIEREGHGPHDIAFGETIEYEWLEPESGADRVPDRWRFSLPAPANVAIRLSEGMLGTLVREGATEATITTAIRDPGWDGRLEAGDYRIEAVALRPNNHLTYQISVDTVQLVAGQTRTVKIPAEIPISLGGNDLIEIGSYGQIDVRAKLYDDKGRVVGANDDRPDDWNFAITGTLPPGAYLLRVDPSVALAPSGEENEPTTDIELHRPAEQVEQALAVPGNAEITDTDVHTWPLQLPGAGLLVIVANSADPVDLSLERAESAQTWRSIGRASGRATFLAVPVAGDGTAYRLRVWSPERRGLKIGLAARMVTTPPISEAKAAADFALAPIENIDPPLYAAAVTPDAPGLLRLPKGVSWSAATGEPARDEEIVIADTGPIWLIARSGGPLRVARLDAGETVKLTLPPAGARLAARPDAGPRLWIAESRSGQPGLAPDQRLRAQAEMGVAEGSAAALGNAAAMALWNAGEPGAALPITLRSLAFATPDTADLPPGDNDLVLAAGAARRFNLPAGTKRLRLKVPAQMMAVLSRGDVPLATLWSDTEARNWTTELPADRLLLLNAGTGEVRAAIGWTPLSGEPPQVTVDRPLKRYEGAAGTLRVAITPKDGVPQKLHVHPASAAVAFVTREGRVLRGQDLLLDGPGTLSITHGPGLVAAWLEAPAGTAPSAIAIAEPVRVLPLSGPVARLAFEPKTAALLRLTSTVPLIASFIAPDGSRVTEVAADGARLARYLPAGRNLVELQSTTVGDLSGEVELVQSPVVPIDEGLGDKVLLSAGERRLYGFTLARAQRIGVGVRAAIDIANCRLFDAAGKELGSGVVQMHTLPAGAYLLAVDLPAEAAPVEIQPALVGAKLPDSGPPMEIRQSYLRLVGRGPSE